MRIVAKPDLINLFLTFSFSLLPRKQLSPGKLGKIYVRSRYKISSLSEGEPSWSVIATQREESFTTSAFDVFAIRETSRTEKRILGSFCACTMGREGTIQRRPICRTSGGNRNTRYTIFSFIRLDIGYR